MYGNQTGLISIWAHCHENFLFLSFASWFTGVSSDDVHYARWPSTERGFSRRRRNRQYCQYGDDCYQVSDAISIWARSRRCGCLVTWFCYVIAKPGNKTAAPSWPGPYNISHEIYAWFWDSFCCGYNHFQGRFTGTRYSKYCPCVSGVILKGMADLKLINTTLRWRHNEPDGVSNHQPHDCLLNRLCGLRWKKTSKLRVTGLCAGNSLETGEFPAQMASNAENVSIWWRHHETTTKYDQARAAYLHSHLVEERLWTNYHWCI